MHFYLMLLHSVHVFFSPFFYSQFPPPEIRNPRAVLTFVERSYGNANIVLFLFSIHRLRENKMRFIRIGWVLMDACVCVCAPKYVQRTIE